ncbi:uncharacterized protein Dvir_GJ25928, isoform B [Drosophila virilis]|uniref:Uncharacterized protein, isoform B n=1 Tax=Drosophila virilis TaxID=7244 RepID=A0A0Q9W7D1_DROVI|nr:uncharacterized protein LOC26530698 isoform X1 [Drosophila virilis]KRF78183.1 uncharacterized protein Dvir_GJ25928, isoform B [Drosophila virilis]
MFVLNDEALVVVVGSCRFQKGILDPVLIPRCACINSMRPYAGPLKCVYFRLAQGEVGCCPYDATLQLIGRHCYAPDILIMQRKDIDGADNIERNQQNKILYDSPFSSSLSSS